jgi:RNA polymerase sigma-70 factor (ECF subfamily)
MVETIPLLPRSSIPYGDAVPVTSMNDPNLDVAACVERVRHRDEEAARQLMHHLHPLVLKLVRAHLPRRTSEEDLTQIVFMKVFARINQFSGAVPLEHWVSRIAINTCLNQIKAEQIRPELRWADLSEEQCEMLESVAADTGERHPVDELAARELVGKLLAALAPRDRLLLTLLHLEGRSVEEVKALTGWNGTLIRVRAFRARQKLRKSFGRLMKGEAP